MSKFKNAVRVGIGALLATSIALTAVGCGDKGYNPVASDPESRPLVLSTNKPDEVFNPFFSSSAVDSSLVSMTQIGLLSADKEGNIVCGENEPSVALDYSVRETGGQTIYQFVIKNGIKFSDGEDLTMDDILFNLYVYLDYAYTGSATMYSTKIVGLNEYRTNDPNATDDSAAAWEEKFQAEANKHVDKLIDYVKHYGRMGNEDERPSAPVDYEKEEAEKDFNRVCKTFREELSNAYNSILGTMESKKEDYKFTAAWQPFLADYVGYMFYEMTPGDAGFVKDDKGNPHFDPTREEVKTCERDLAEYIEEHKNDEGYKYEEAVKEWAVNDAFNNYLGETIEETWGDQFEFVLTAFETEESIRTYFKTVAANKEFSGDRKVNSISGITTEKASEFVTTGGQKGTYSDAYKMLQIKVNGVDPKAIYNFSFIVAPRHYYGDDSYKNADTGAGVNEFGVAPGDPDFMDEVVKAPEKNSVPVGAGPYKATNASSADDIKSGFCSDNIVYYKRNDYFTTVGSGLENAKIKFLRYQVIDSDQIISSLNSGSIDFGEPSATDTNEKMLNKNIKGETAWTNGYGYVGVNARFVTNINVRRAIMKAMDTSIIVNDYYKGGYAEIIYRSMSSKSWAYPKGVTTYVSKDNNTSYAFDSTGKDIQKLIDSVLDNGYYEGSDGIYTNGNDTLNYTFTIAGGSKDHPAYKMFLKAAEILNACHGIKVNVVTSANALSDLNSGKLAVWAAAWISAIDPDMYQVYHKDSQASSVRNWGYDYIMKDQKTYSYEWSIVKDLSKLIDQARQTTNQDARKGYYKDALDLVMELAVELPTYQRKDLFAYNRNYIDPDTLQPSKDLSPTNGPLARIWEVNYYLEGNV